MRRIIFVAIAATACLAASNATAGRLLGDIRLDGKPVEAGLTVRLALAPAQPGGAAVVADSTTTDKFGSYKLMAKADGKYVLTLIYEKQPVSLEVFSYKEPTRYDLVLEKKDGKLNLRRK